MPRQLHLEGAELQPLLARARAEHGDALTVVSAQRVRSGGFGGFFARERYEVTVQLPDPSDGPAAPAPARAEGSGTAVRSTAAAGSLDELLAAADRADRAEGSEPRVAQSPGRPAVPADLVPPAGQPTPTRRPGRPLSTESPGFDDVLAALRADLLGPGTLGTVAPRTAAVPTLAPVTSSWQPMTFVDVPPAGDVAVPDRPAGDISMALPDLADGPAVDVSVADGRSGAHPVPGPPVGVPVAAGSDVAASRTLSPDELVELARLVGAEPTRAAAAAADVSATGVTAASYALPLLATALAQDLAADLAARSGRDAHRVSAGDVAPGAPTTAAPLGARAGELVVVVGAPTEVTRAARDVAALLGTPWLARWSDEPGTGRRRAGALVLDHARGLPVLLGRARAAGLPLVVELADPTLVPGASAAVAGSGRSTVVRALDPDLVVLVVDADASARRQTAVTSRVQVAYGVERSLVLALVGCAEAASPLVHAPVALLDGRPATVGTWTGVLLDALRYADAAR